jgi:hypothetical protein
MNREDLDRLEIIKAAKKLGMVWPRDAAPPAAGLHVCPKHDNDIVPASGCPKCTAHAADAEPVAWQYEIATQIIDGHYACFDWRLGTTEPCVPEGSIRNLRPLVYGDTRPAAPPAAASDLPDYHRGWNDGYRNGVRSAADDPMDKEAARPAPAADDKPIASIYVTPDGAREFDDWRHPLPVGRNLLYTRPAAPLSEGRADVLLNVIQRLNQNPYSLTKAECVDLVSAMRDEALAAPSPPPQPTDEATDAGRLDWMDDNPYAVSPDSYGYLATNKDRRWSWQVASAHGAASTLRAAIDAARLATPPDNAAGREDSDA